MHVLKKLGKEIKAYKGVSTMIQQLNSMIQKNSDFKKAGVNLEFYIVSQGIEVSISASKDFLGFQVYASNFSEDKKTAWFDELLMNQSYGECRGTGVMVLENGAWKIAQYHLTIPIPNELAREVVSMIRKLKK